NMPISGDAVEIEGNAFTSAFGNGKTISGNQIMKMSIKGDNITIKDQAFIGAYSNYRGTINKNHIVDLSISDSKTVKIGDQAFISFMGNQGSIKGSKTVNMSIDSSKIDIGEQISPDIFANYGTISERQNINIKINKVNVATVNNDGQLTEITVPNNINSIGYGAFDSHPIKKVTIGTNVNLLSSKSNTDDFNHFGNYDGGRFKEIYNEKGAGVYNYNEVTDVWSKE
ncbi:MAG: hypothetical protein PHI87_02095, partial [Candidatus Methanomethylophilus sp.]|nr:hypothetical protein [Methanomethylophilus sp.]